MSGEWIPGAVIALAGSALVFWRNSAAVEAAVNAKIIQLQKDDENHTDEIKVAIDAIHKIATRVEVAVEKQDVINQMFTRTLTGISNRLETQAHQLGEHSTAIELNQKLLTKVMGG